MNELMEVAGSSLLHEGMGLWFEQEAVEEEPFSKLIRGYIGHLKRLIIKRRELIAENEALGERGVVLDSMDALKETQAKQT